MVLENQYSKLKKTQKQSEYSDHYASETNQILTFYNQIVVTEWGKEKKNKMK